MFNLALVKAPFACSLPDVHRKTLFDGTGPRALPFATTRPAPPPFWWMVRGPPRGTAFPPGGLGGRCAMPRCIVGGHPIRPSSCEDQHESDVVWYLAAMYICCLVYTVLSMLQWMGDQGMARRRK